MPATPAMANGWLLSQPTSAHPLQLILGSDAHPTYLFACNSDNVSATNFGVTGLLDLQTGQKIPDDVGASITPGASVIALFTGDGQPDMVPADAAHNSLKGWDLTIHLAKNDEKLVALKKADVISLFTTGYTLAAQLHGDDKAVVREFLKQCNVQ